MKELFSSPSKPNITIEEIDEIGPYAIVPMKKNANIGYGESSSKMPVSPAFVETEVNVNEDRDVSEDRDVIEDRDVTDDRDVSEDRDVTDDRDVSRPSAPV